VLCNCCLSWSALLQVFVLLVKADAGGRWKALFDGRLEESYRTRLLREGFELGEQRLCDTYSTTTATVLQCCMSSLELPGCPALRLP
jgi:hypothetical protein